MTKNTRSILRILYLPWCWLMFIPFMVVWTFLSASAAIVSSLFSDRLANRVGVLWAWTLCRVNFTSVSVTGREHLVAGQPYVLMSNHVSHFDVLAVLGHFGPRFQWIIKQELRKIPVFGFANVRAGNIFVDRRDRQKALDALNAAKPTLERGISLMFFPEGTRSEDGRLREFKKGGFMVALQLGFPILPITITGSGHVLPARSFRLLPGSIRLEIHPPVNAKSFGMERREELMDHVREVIASGLKSDPTDS